MFCKKGVLRNFSKFTRKHVWQRLWHMCFPVNFEKFLKTPFFTEHPWWLLLNNIFRRNRIFEQPLLSIDCSSIQFFNSFFVIYGTPCCARGHHSHLIFCDLRDNTPPQRSLLLSLTFHVQSVPREAEDFPEGDKYFNHAPLLA